MEWLSDDIEITDDSRPYKPYGGSRELFRCREPLVLIEGPAGTGKTRGVLEKAHVAASKYPGCRIVICRATRVSMTHSVLVTFEKKVVPVGHPILKGAHRPNRDSYIYPNGSEIVTGGLDNADRLLSTEYDMACVFEATECRKEDVEKLTTRLRNNVMPYQQLICDCNPSGPSHWLNIMAGTVKMVRILSRHRDNPSVSNAYLQKLSSLYGAMRARFFEGRWVQSDGLVYDNFDLDMNVVKKEYDWEPTRVVAGVDEGYTNPFCCLRIEMDCDSRMHVAAERYQTGLLMSEMVDAVQDLVMHRDAHDQAPEADLIVYDSAAPRLGASLKKAGLPARACKKGPDSIVDGCHLVRQRLAVQGDRLPRLTIDPSCTNLLNELDTYEWSKRTDGSTKDKPVDQFNHACDALRYLVMAIDSKTVASLTCLDFGDEDDDEPKERVVEGEKPVDSRRAFYYDDDDEYDDGWD